MINMNFEKNVEDSSRDEKLEDNIEHLDENLTEEVHISTTLSSKKILELIDEYPNLKIITCPKSIFNRISKKYLEVLNKLGITVKIKYNWGKPVKYKETDWKNVITLIKQGMSPQDIAEKLNMPIQTIYYLKNKDKNELIRLKRGKRKKYNNKIREKVKKLANDGVPKKKISENENIPLRTVYDIVNEK